MPLTMARPGECYQITRVGGLEKTRKFLASLGFVIGSKVAVVNEMNGNLIVNIKDSRIGVSKEMAAKIQIQ